MGMFLAVLQVDATAGCSCSCNSFGVRCMAGMCVFQNLVTAADFSSDSLPSLPDFSGSKEGLSRLLCSV